MFHSPQKRKWDPELVQQSHIIKHVPYRDKLKRFWVYIY